MHTHSDVRCTDHDVKKGPVTLLINVADLWLEVGSARLLPYYNNI